MSIAGHLRRQGWLVVVAALLLAPFAVAGAWLYAHDRFAPIFDLALTELRVRDVGTTHTPLIGLPGRLGRSAIASHPGPLSFYLLAPAYRMLGGSYWALRISGLVLHATAIVSSLAIAQRRAGMRGTIGVGVVVAVLEVGFGLLVFTEPWNPNLPVLWFLVFLLSVWSVTEDDPWFLPVAALTACSCGQTHIPYLAVCGGLGLFALIAWAFHWKRAARCGSSTTDHSRSFLAALAIVAVTWAPPVIEQMQARPGNLWLLFDYFSNPPTRTVGVAKAARLVAAHLDVWHLIVDAAREPGILAKVGRHDQQLGSERGLAVLVLWSVSAFTGRKAGDRALVSLNCVLGASLCVEVFAISHVIGEPWHYLLYSSWVVGALVVLAAVWGIIAPFANRTSEVPMQYIGVAVIASCAIRLLPTRADAGTGSVAPARQLAGIASQISAAARWARSRNAVGPYLVVWADPFYGGAQGIGLIDELERMGLRALGTPEYARLLTNHRVGTMNDARLLLYLAGGDWIRDARSISGATELAYFDPRDARDRQESEADRAMLATALTELGHADAAAKLGRNITDAQMALAPYPLLTLTLNRMVELGIPAALFLLPLSHGAPKAVTPVSAM
jgi:hypothetical protein